MRNKYDKILNDLITRFTTDKDIDESTRRIVKDVINAELTKINLKTPHNILNEIKSIIESEAKQRASEI